MYVAHWVEQGAMYTSASEIEAVYIIPILKEKG